MTVEAYANDYETSLNGSVTSARPVTLTFRDTIPATLTGGNFRIRIDNEWLLVPAGGVSGLVCTGCTTVEGSTAAAHPDRAVVDQVLTRQGLLNSPGPMTTKGDIIYADTGGEPKRLPLGTTAQVLTADASGVPAWAAGGGGSAGSVNALDTDLVNLMKQVNDYIVANGSGISSYAVDTSITVGTAIALIFFKSSAGSGTWQTPTNAKFTAPVGKSSIVTHLFPASVMYDQTNRRVRLRNVTDSTTLIDYKQFATVTSAGAISDDYAFFGDSGASVGFDQPGPFGYNIPVGKQVEIETWNTDATQRAGGAVVIIRCFPSGLGGLIVIPQGGITVPGLISSPDQQPSSPGANDDEFETTAASTPTGWSAGTQAPSSVDANTSAKSQLYLKSTVASDTLKHIYKAAPATPYTVIAKLSDHSVVIATGASNIGIFVADAAPPVKAVALQLAAVEAASGSVMGGSGATAASYTSIGASPATGATDIATRKVPYAGGPLYMKMRVVSATDISMYVSYNGLIWIPVVVSFSSGLANVGQVGLYVDKNASTLDIEAMFDFIRFS